MVGAKTKHARKRHERNETTAARADERKRQPRRRNRAAYNRKIYRALNRDDCGDSRRKVTFESGFCVYRDFYARIYVLTESKKPRAIREFFVSPKVFSFPFMNFIIFEKFSKRDFEWKLKIKHDGKLIIWEKRIIIRGYIILNW